MTDADIGGIIQDLIMQSMMQDMIGGQGQMKQLASNPIINVIPGLKDPWEDDQDLLDSDDKVNSLAT